MNSVRQPSRFKARAVAAVGNTNVMNDRNDFAKPDAQAIESNPKSSGRAPWNYPAAWDLPLAKSAAKKRYKKRHKKRHGNSPRHFTTTRRQPMPAQAQPGDMHPARRRRRVAGAEEVGFSPLAL